MNKQRKLLQAKGWFAMNKSKTKYTKEYCYIVHKDVNHYVDNRPTDRAPKVEYTDDMETARRFFEEDFEILQIDWSKHDKIICESTHIRIHRSERVEVNE
ncbi:DUF2483 domain-containing protein [Staphylococcus pseudoxylosus]|uniref:DUF2483 domain-containing protein n=2 Tax=Staphylococcus pseudoxylosus TaxID=2282419 RepID=A0AAQ0MJL5_9STAP|nr:DUF2483 domain-containing protein [Staphylococcus pseudoxylosus]